MTRRHRKFLTLERKFLKIYSAWEETHEWGLAEGSRRLLGQLLRLNPAYSLRRRFQRAF